MPDLTSQDVAEIKSFLSRTYEDVLIWLPGTGWQPAWQSEAANELGNSEVGASSSLLTRSPVPMRPPPADRGNRRDSVSPPPGRVVAFLPAGQGLGGRQRCGASPLAGRRRAETETRCAAPTHAGAALCGGLRGSCAPLVRGGAVSRRPGRCFQFMRPLPVGPVPDI
jgi:hypothetical protein